MVGLKGTNKPISPLEIEHTQSICSILGYLQDITRSCFVEPELEVSQCGSLPTSDTFSIQLNHHQSFSGSVLTQTTRAKFWLHHFLLRDLGQHTSPLSDSVFPSVK